MALQVIVSAGLAVFFVYCFFFIGATAPEPNATNMDAAQWPQVILFLLVVLLIMNIYNTIKATPKEKRSYNLFAGIDFAKLYQNKLLIGIVLLFAYATALEPLGFIVSTFVFAMAYACLLGEKRPVRLAIIAFIATAAIYIIFSRALGIMLPRGYGVLRDFALMLESF